MKNRFAFFLAILALAFAGIAIYQKAHAADIIHTPGANGAEATVTMAEVEHGAHHIACSGPTVDDMVTVCHDTLVKLCPNGGHLTLLGETPDGVVPVRIEFDVVCTEDGTS